VIDFNKIATSGGLNHSVDNSYLLKTLVIYTDCNNDIASTTLDEAVEQGIAGVKPYLNSLQFALGSLDCFDAKRQTHTELCSGIIDLNNGVMNAVFKCDIDAPVIKERFHTLCSLLVKQDIFVNDGYCNFIIHFNPLITDRYYTSFYVNGGDQPDDSL
jgi:hypothetical protein